LFIYTFAIPSFALVQKGVNLALSIGVLLVYTTFCTSFLHVFYWNTQRNGTPSEYATT